MDKAIDSASVALRVHESDIRAPFIEEEPNDFSELASQLRDNLNREKPTMLVEWLASRGISGKVVRKFGLGWSSGRIAFPYYDEERVFGIKYRDQYGNKTYEPGSRRGIYNLNAVRQRPIVFLMEGESDTLAMWTHLTSILTPARMTSIGVGGYPGAQSTKAEWETRSIDLHWAERVYIAFDADEAGDKGAATVASVLGDRAVRLRPTLGKDYNEHFMNGGTLDVSLD
jgi:hypothetical protein